MSEAPAHEGAAAAGDRAAVAVDGAEAGAVGRGLLALVGMTHEDDVAAAATRRQDGATARCSSTTPDT